MKILVIGLGSIGLRHLNNLLQLQGLSISVVTKREPDSLGDYTSVHFFSSLSDALSNRYDAALICSPTANHLEQIEILLNHSIYKIYCEKPMSHSFIGLESVYSKIQELNADVRIGFDLRLDIGFRKVKSLINKGIIGTVLSFQGMVGQFLPDWRPFTDYRQSYSAKKELGGGVLLDLSHELDFIVNLFGKPNQVCALCKNTGSLEIETEDLVNVLFNFSKGLTGSLQMDYLQKTLRRRLLIVGTEGELEWNLAHSKVNLTNSNETRLIVDYADIERNTRFQLALNDFLYETPQSTLLSSVEDAIFNLKLIDYIKESSATSKLLNI